MIRILLIGPLPPPMGGDTRHFATLLEDLQGSPGFRVTLFNTSRGQGYSKTGRNFITAFRTVVAVAANLKDADIISLHASDRGMFLFGPFIRLLGFVSRTPTVLRLFGGSFGDYYQAKGRLGRLIMRRCILSADVVLLQTRRMIGQLQAHASGRLEWFSTYINLPRDPGWAAALQTAKHSRCTRFVFLGHLRKVKGVETLLSAASRLPEDCHIDMYGPLDEYSEEEIVVRGAGRVVYKGFLTHDEVNARLWEYDCLVLPTFHKGEGYPGVIAEAFAHALPVITTRWQAIPEIVDDACGLLIEPGDAQAFVDAVTVLNADSARWQELRRGAAERAMQFDHAVWSRKFEAICARVAEP